MSLLWWWSYYLEHQHSYRWKPRRAHQSCNKLSLYCKAFDKLCQCGGKITIAGDLSLALQILRAVFFKCSKFAKLPKAIEEDLLLLLSMGSQNLLGQPQLFVGLPFLTLRWNSQSRTPIDLAGLCSFSCNWDVFNYLCLDDRVDTSFTFLKEKKVWVTHLFSIYSNNKSSTSEERNIQFWQALCSSFH